MNKCISQKKLFSMYIHFHNTHTNLNKVCFCHAPIPEFACKNIATDSTNL